jgi:hypothetical protein
MIFIAVILEKLIVDHLFSSIFSETRGSTTVSVRRPLDSLESQMNLGHILTPISLRATLILSFHRLIYEVTKKVCVT